MALNWDGFGNSLSFRSCNWDVENDHFSESKGFSEAVNRLPADPFGMENKPTFADRLPADPFGMEIRSTFAAAITSWIHDVENDFGSDFYVFGTQEDGEKNKIVEPQNLFKGLNLVWNGTLNFPQEQSTSSYCGFGSEHVHKTIDDQSSCDDSEGEAPHSALFYALGYLGVKDLLVVERVCKSLRDAVRSDPLLWRNIHIGHSLSKLITDDALLKLTSRAQGTIECLSLVGCNLITDDGLNRVLESNPKLTKLRVPECTRLNVEAILFNLRAFKSVGFPGIKHLRIGGSFSVTEEQFEELKSLLGTNNSMQLRERKPHFFPQGRLHLLSDDDRAIDIEVCPRCRKLKLVYDCPSESCRRTCHSAQLCRACILCIARCIRCGCCFKDCDYEETFTLDLLCFNCRNHG